MNDAIRDNILKHERIAGDYDNRHPEIYNDAEQVRLTDAIDRCISHVQTESAQLSVLDYGCGAGNLTRIFLDRGCLVTAADVTPSFLQVVRDRTGDAAGLSTMLLNGEDLLGVPDGAYDIVAAYSVLHHIPDYLRAVADCVRVLKPGGVLFLDHEHNTEKWAPSVTLLTYRKLSAKRTTISYYIRSLLSPRWYAKKLKKLRNPRYQEEGDIHVWPDDHIEWEVLLKMLERSGMSTIVIEDYLGYEPDVYPDIYAKFRDLCSDMKLYIGRRNQ